ncbi:cytochrome P450 [Saccharopolyspora sp. NFXS83]|uniref:cytochrome P450 n=1 Tax=Saccharopolyspora sp. NFXS83 TaxID=2993560 RepID=UPI00224AB24B|nr:cytochrome P450 [Saccharopolyspora sp. NFXS83]MCX2729829.1 cytochrome P450 [Saccharopolyspora sp. NFXS83]
MSSATDSATADASPAPELPLHMRRNGFDPVPDLAAVRASTGITRFTTPFGADAWLVTRHADVRSLLGDAQRFSTAAYRPDFGLPPEKAAELNRGNLLNCDPPEHTRLRRMLTPEFTVRRMRRLQPRIEEIVGDHLDAMERAGSPRDLVADFALPIPSLVICELLGVPYEDRAEFQVRTGKALDTSLPGEERARNNVEQRTYMRELVERAQADPGEDLLGMLVREHGDAVEAADLTGIASLLLVAGHETTASMLGLGTLALLRHPDQLALVRDEPERIGPAVEELMRWLSIVHSGTPRMTTAEVEIAGQVVPAGSTVVFALPGANRDDELVDDPDALDVTRKPGNHVGFGHGVHHCVGAPLARMEMCTAFPALLRRFPNLRAVTPDDEIEFRAFHFVYSLKKLEVAW